MIGALSLFVFSGNAYAHDISVQKLKYDNDQGIATKWSKTEGDATFTLYKVNESDKPMEIAAKVEKEGGNKAGEVSISEEGLANFTDIDTGYYVLVETKHSGTHAKPMYFYLDKNVNIYTKNETGVLHHPRQQNHRKQYQQRNCYKKYQNLPTQDLSINQHHY